MTEGKAQAMDNMWQEQSFQINYFILCGFLSPISLSYFHELSSSHCCCHSPPIQLLGTEASVLSYPLAPSRETFHGYPQDALIFLLQSSPPDTDYSA